MKSTQNKFGSSNYYIYIWANLNRKGRKKNRWGSVWGTSLSSIKGGNISAPFFSLYIW